MAKRTREMSMLEWLAEQEWLPPLLAERAAERAERAAYMAWREAHPEHRRPWEDGYTDQPRSAEEQALAKKAFRIRMSTDETRFKNAVAEIVEKYPTGDDPTSVRYQAHSSMREDAISALFRKRWDAEALAFGRKTMGERRGGGINGGGKARRATKEAWQENATRTYEEFRAKFPKDSARNLAKRIVVKLTNLVPGEKTVARWVADIDKSRRP
jgi:hypothetical protein